MGNKQWPYQSAPYKVLDVTPQAAAFNRDPDQVHILNYNGNRILDSMESDLRKWREGGKLTEPDVEWWRTHINGERDMEAPSAPSASSFHHFSDPGNQDEMAYQELDVLRAHINTLSNEKIVSFLHILKFVQKSY